VVNVTLVRCKLNFLLLAALAVMGKVLSCYMRKDRGNETGSIKDREVSSSRATHIEYLI
jgi:hypothetical protein